MYVYGYDNGRDVDYILVDAGVTFPDPEYTPGRPYNARYFIY